MTTCYTLHSSPLGELLLVGDGHALTGLYMPDHRRGPTIDATWIRTEAAFEAALGLLDRYLAGDLETIDVPLSADGTPFQRRVWDELRRIPYGETVTYGELADRLGRPGAARAVGGAVARNPISIVVPCHRVVGSGGRLTGYAGGLDRKRWLLELEAVARSRPLAVAR